ncbi:MAG TPA: N-acetylmuramoyl-L-alanine amidase [Chloroflexota bacterium]|nr:N-acetylmuramoyl-L-alanine amidase [Chloroflexota bacterium]
MAISRAAWGSPDGEDSPRWIPFFKQPYHIVIHHTDSGYSGDGSSDVRSIWAYHTFGNGWGDIGYNFVIDPQGNVYEGRAGGPTAVGAHTEHYNSGAIGISLIGNFDAQTPPPAMVKALIGLVARLGNQFGINMEGVTDDGTLTFANLAGHRDFYATSCPGINLYRLLPALRTAVTRQMRSEARLDGPTTIYVASAAPSFALLRLRNTGTTTWNGRFSARRLAGNLPGLPGGYNLPGIPPGGTVSIPLFLPALAPGQELPTTWRVFDASGFPAGSPFTITISALATGQPTPVPPTQTATASLTAPPTLTGTPTASPTPTRVETATATTTPSATLSPTESPTVSGTPSPTATSLIQHLLPVGTGSPTSTPSPVPSPTQASYLLPDEQRPPGGSSRSSSPNPVPGNILVRRPSIASRPNRVPSAAGVHAAGRSREVGSLDTVGGAARLWYFAEGSSAARDRETLAFVNPGSDPAYVVTTLVRADGRHAYVVTDVPSDGRATLDVTDAAGPGDGLGAIIRASQPLYVSRTEYHGSMADEGTSAATTIGIRSPAPVWYVPAMPVIAGESERLSLLNPAATGETVRVSLVTGGLLRPYQVVVVKPLGIRAITLPHGTASAEVRQVGTGSGVVVEARQSYQGDTGFTAASGLDSLITSGYFVAPAGGGHRDSVMLLNPNSQPATLRLSGLDARSKSVWSRSIRITAGRQVSVGLPKDDGTWSAVFFQSNLPIAAGFSGLLAPGGESSLAAHYRGMVTEEPTAPVRQHIFSEGDTRTVISGPAERVYLVNPIDQPATISLNLLGTGGRRLVKVVSLAPRAATSVNINAWAPPSQHGLLVLSDQPILAAQTITFNLGADRLYSNGVVAP